MIAAISPADINYEESYSTLLYANQVKSIKTNAVKNVSAKDKIIKELKEENERLKKLMENKQSMAQENKQEQKEQENILSKVRIMNVNEDPMLNGKMNHPFHDGVNVIGRSKKGKKPDIVMNGLGIVAEHNRVSYDEKTNMLVLHPNAESFKKNKTYLNGELLKEDTPLKHGDKIIFGNNTVYVVLFPDETITDEMRDYESAMAKIHEQQLKALKDDNYEKEMKEKLSKIKSDMEADRKNVEKDLLRRQKEMDEASKRLEEELRLRDLELKNKIKEAGDDKDKLSEFENKLKKEKADAEKLRKQQEEKEKQLEEEKRRALRAFEEAQKKREEEELDMRFREKLDAQLTQMIQMCNDANEMCRTLGRYQYLYVPSTEIVIMPDGTKVPKVI
jgi:pSer/pThr/pTyr-binding forkhead associated (FHA) protein